MTNESTCVTDMPKLLYYQSEGAVMNELSTMTGETDTNQIDVVSLFRGTRSLAIRLSLQSLASSITCIDFDSDEDDDKDENSNFDLLSVERKLRAACGNQEPRDQQVSSCEQDKDSMPALPVRRESLRERPDEVPKVPGRRPSWTIIASKAKELPKSSTSSRHSMDIYRPTIVATRGV